MVARGIAVLSWVQKFDYRTFPGQQFPSWFNKVVSIQTYVGWQLYVGLLNYEIEFSRCRCDTTAFLIIFYVPFLFCLFILFISKCNCKIINRHFYLNLLNDIITITIIKLPAQQFSLMQIPQVFLIPIAIIFLFFKKITDIIVFLYCLETSKPRATDGRTNCIASAQRIIVNNAWTEWSESNFFKILYLLLKLNKESWRFFTNGCSGTSKL